MQVLLGYGFDREPDRAEVANRLRRVASHYEPLWRVPVQARGVDAGRVGLHVWDAANSPWRWPSWQRDAALAVATLYLPFGYERVVGDIEPERAPPALARALAQRPASVLELTAPFVVAALDSDRSVLRLHTDGIGLGRLFELRFPGGWVWSNRPIAACRFAGIPAEADRDGWRAFAAVGWFLGEQTPVAGVYAVPAGVSISYDPHGLGRVSQQVDALAAYASGQRADALAPERIDEVAEAMCGFARSLGRISSGPVQAGLSGGRDSRVVVAASLAAGLTLRLHTNAAEPGEAEVALRLLAALPAEAASRVTHRIDRPGEPDQAAAARPAVSNALAWHRLQEGLRPESYLPTTAPRGLAPAEVLTLSGVAGEIGHGFYYPADYAALSRLPFAERLDAIAGRLVAKLVVRHGLSAAARSAATQRLQHTLAEAFRRGLHDVKVLDYFYANERLRRWGTAPDRIGTIAPLLVPEFVRAAFDLTPDQRRENALHRAVTARLIPQWGEEPYYQRPTGLVPPALAPRLGQAHDADVIAAIVARPDVWSDGYEPGAVARSWGLLRRGHGRPADERLLQRVIWRAAFADYLTEVNDGLGRPGPPAPAGQVPAPVHASVDASVDRSMGDSAGAQPGQPVPRSDGALLSGRRFAARGLRRVARAVDPDHPRSQPPIKGS